MIEVKDLTIGYKLSKGRVKEIHRNLSFAIKDGEMTALLGANGAGKSTLIKSLSGFIPTISGQVIINGRDVALLSRTELSREVGVVLTARPADGGLTVFDLVSFGRYPYTNYFGSFTPYDIEIIENAMESVGVSHLRDAYVSRISDGERQKAMIAKVLAQECRTIILDEPTAFLDVKSRLETYSLLHQIAHDKNKSVLLSTHDLETTLRHADSLVMLSKYNPLVIGTTEELVLDGSVARLFEGEKKSPVWFNDRDGSFRIDFDAKPTVFIDSEDEVIGFWVENFLIKHKFLIAKSESKAAHKVEVISSNNMIADGVKCCSFSELLGVMTKANS
ncbi:MAG: ABC transporter ATP-binding protein [Rikenellaceae bacterium]